MPFHPFSREHFITVVVGFGIVAAILILARRGGNHRRFTTALLAFANLSAYPASLAAWLTLDTPPSLDNLLPFHLCDIAAITAGLALITRRPILCALTYFWGLAATFQALLTPELSLGFPSWPFLTFFIQHFAIVATSLYLPVVMGWRPKKPFWRSPLAVYGWSIGYITGALLTDPLLRTNFGFVTRPPENPSLIDHLGPWPWYLFSMQAIAVVLFLLLALPFGLRKKTSDQA